MSQRLLKEYKDAPRIERIYVILLGFLLMSLPAEGLIRAFPNIMLIVLVLMAPFLYAKRRPDMHAFRLLIGWGAFLGLAAIIALIGGYLVKESHFFIRFLLVGLVVLLFLPVKNWNPLKRFFIIGVVFALLISGIKLIGFTLEHGKFAFSSGAAINEVLITDRLYLGLFATLALVFCLDLSKSESRPNKHIYLGIGLLCILFVLMVAARMALLTMLVLGVCYFIYYRKYKWLFAFVLASGFFLFLFFLVNPNLRNRFFYVDKKKSFVENVQHWEPRFLIWGCGLESLSDPAYNPALGFGSFTEAQEALRSCYTSRIQKAGKRAYYEAMDFNPHNQYLGWTLAYGYIVGLGFVAYLLALAFTGKISFSTLGWTVCFMLFAMVESFIHRQMGMYLFALLIALCSSLPKQEKSKSINGDRP